MFLGFFTGSENRAITKTFRVSPTIEELLAYFKTSKYNGIYYKIQIYQIHEDGNVKKVYYKVTKDSILSTQEVETSEEDLDDLDWPC
jgi:hypothetical protein